MTRICRTHSASPLLVVLAASALAVAADDFPHAFPRTGVTRLLDHERFTMWEVNWKIGVPQPIHRHRYDMAGVYLRFGTITVTTPDGKATTGDPFPVPRPYFQVKDITHKEEAVGAPGDPGAARHHGGPEGRQLSRRSRPRRTRRHSRVMARGTSSTTRASGCGTTRGRPARRLRGTCTTRTRLRSSSTAGRFGPRRRTENRKRTSSRSRTRGSFPADASTPKRRSPGRRERSSSSSNSPPAVRRTDRTRADTRRRLRRRQVRRGSSSSAMNAGPR